MVAVTHQTFGVTFGLLSILLIQFFGMKPEGLIDTIIFFVLVLFGSLLPDLDTPHSKLGRKFWPISFLISLFVKHRTATHSLLFFIIVVGVSGLLVNMFDLSWFYAIGISVGTLSHLVGDMLTNRGIPLLYPFVKKSFRMPLTFRTGSAKESVICMGLIFMNIILFLYLSGTGKGLLSFLSFIFQI